MRAPVKKHALHRMAWIPVAAVLGLTACGIGDESAESSTAYATTTAQVSFSVRHGVFDQPINVALSASEAGTIRFTRDGSPPTATTGEVFSAPLSISKTTILRAAVFRPDGSGSAVQTQSYVFFADVSRQSAAAGFDGTAVRSHARWGHDKRDLRPDWDVDQRIVQNSDPANRFTAEDLKAMPLVSIALPWDDMFGPNGQGIYIDGEGVPKNASIEVIENDGSPGAQVNGSVEITGGSSTGRWKADKLSMRLKFKEELGAKKFEHPVFGPNAASAFKTLILDAGLNFTWHHASDREQRDEAKFIQDQYVADLQKAMGGKAAHGRFMHLFIDGMYWGMYGMHERPDEHFQASYQGGDDEDYDVLKHNSGDVVSGTADKYNQLLDLVRRDARSAEGFRRISEMLDVDAFADYMLLNFYVGNTDWAHQNWYASFNKVQPGGRWRFHSWDAEHVLKSVRENVTGKSDRGSPTEIHRALLANPAYRAQFATRARMHLTGEGALTPAKTAGLYQKLMTDVRGGIAGESARWGDNRKSPGYTRRDWESTQNDLLKDYFPRRTETVIGQLRAAGLI